MASQKYYEAELHVLQILGKARNEGRLSGAAGYKRGKHDDWLKGLTVREIGMYTPISSNMIRKVCREHQDIHVAPSSHGPGSGRGHKWRMFTQEDRDVETRKAFDKDQKTQRASEYAAMLGGTRYDWSDTIHLTPEAAERLVEQLPTQEPCPECGHRRGQ